MIQLKVRLGNLVGVLGSLLVFVGTLGVASPMCVGWFYSPKLPGELNQNKCEYKKISLKEYSNNVKKQISFLLCFIVVFSFVSVAFAQNQFYVSDEKLLEQNKGLRSEIESQINNNLKKSNINYSEEYNREVTLDLIGDIDTIRKSYQQPVKVYSEIIIGEDDSRLDSHLNVGNQAILSTNTKNESWISSGRPITCTISLKAWKQPNQDFHYEGFYDYKLYDFNFYWTSSQVLDGVARIDVLAAQRDARDIFENYRRNNYSTWWLENRTSGAAGYLYSPNIYSLLLSSMGYCTSNTTIQLLWGNVGQTEDVGLGWNSFAFPWS